MNGIVNVKTAKYAEWVIAGAGGPMFLGKVVEEKDGELTLEPAYEWISQTSLAAHGQVNRMRIVLPLEMLVGLPSVTLRPSVCIPLARAAEVDIKILDACIERAEASRKNLIPGGSRIVVPAAG